MTTIQKFGSKESHIHTKEKVIALVDEGHRSQYRLNAEAMRYAMPNAVFFAFSGTPIDKKNRSTYRSLVLFLINIHLRNQKKMATH